MGEPEYTPRVQPTFSGEIKNIKNQFLDKINTIFVLSVKFWVRWDFPRGSRSMLKENCSKNPTAKAH